MNKLKCDRLYSWLIKDRRSKMLQCLICFAVFVMPSLLVIEVGTYEHNGLETTPGVCIIVGTILPLAVPGYLNILDKKVTMSRTYFFAFVAECVVTICCLGVKVYNHSFMNVDSLKHMINIPMCFICMSIMYYLIELMFNRYGKDGETTVT